MEDSFIPFFEQFKNTHPKVMEQIIYEGSIYDRAKLEAEYTKAKVFALSSNGESLPNVYAEAAIKGCFIVCTNLDCARDITNEGKYGITVPVYDYKHFGEALIQACLDEKRLGRLCYAIQLRARREYDWTQLCYQIEEWLHGIK